MTLFDKAFEEVKLLAEKFENNLPFYNSPNYQEAEARLHFINPFFEALGWDVRHINHPNPYEQEVKVEKSQKQQLSVAQKRADYAFFMAPNFKDVRFFAEAKKPSVSLQHEDHYFQTIRYGWNANTPLAILTDFEEFHILDCRYKPDLRFVFNGQHKQFFYTDYKDKEKFAEIYWLFSREAVLNNSLEKYAASLPKPKGKAVQKTLFKGGYQAIDDSFLQYIDAIREDLAKAFKKNDEALSSHELTEAVQRTVDRLVFIRFLEDKLIEPENHVSEWRGWKDFIADCRKLDAKYNGVVFKKHFIDEQAFTGAEEISFKKICTDISNLNTPYDFNYIPIHILGSIYERFLGKVVRATDKRVFIEEKPEVRKAGGVYYTPKYIVDYIVKNTVGKLIEGKTPKQIAALRFADIACGSGSFLIGVYDLLLDYHKNYYTEKLKDKTEIDGRSEDYGYVEYRDKQWIITLKLKQDILVNNIYGVDIDAQAVEVTQLSLFLKMLEDETLNSTTVRQGSLFSKVLPDLSKNIVCGNSLMGTDILNDKLFSFEEEKKLNPMDFEAAFPGIMKDGGFDAVVGNPPYVFGRDWKSLGIPDFVKKYFIKQYRSSPYQLDMFSIFMEKSVIVCKENGYCSYIVPNVWLTNTYSSSTRKFIFENSNELNITVPLSKVFKGITVDTIIYIVNKGKASTKTFDIFQIGESLFNHFAVYDVDQYKSGEKPISTSVNKVSYGLIDKMQSCKYTLGKIADITRGVHSYRLGGYGQSAFLKGYQTERDIESRPYHSKEFKTGFRPFIYGKDLKRFTPPLAKEYIQYGKWLAEPRESKYFESDRVYSRKILSERLLVTFVNDNSVADQQVYITIPKLKDVHSKVFAAILGSKLISFYIKNFFDEVNDAFPQIKVSQLKSLPIPEIDNGNLVEINIQLVRLVTQMLDAKNNLQTAKTERDKTFLENKCTNIDRQIDNLVYQLYNLTEEEIKIIEGQ